MSVKIQIKRGTTAQWASSSNDTTLAPGQLGVEYLTSGYSRLKVGTDDSSHSSTDWADLNYLTPSTQTYQDMSIQGTNFTALDWNPSTGVTLGDKTNVTYVQGGTVIFASNNGPEVELSSDELRPYTSGSITLGAQGASWKLLCLSDAESATISQNGNGIYFGADTYPTIQHYSTYLYFNPSGSTTTGGRLTLSTTALYPSTNGGTDLGTSSYQFGNIHIQDATSTSASSGGNGIYFGSDAYQTIYHNGTSLYFNPSGSSSSGGRLVLTTTALHPATNGVVDLGTSTLGWKNLYLGSLISSHISDNGQFLSPSGNVIGSWSENTDRYQMDSLGDIASTFDSISLGSDATIYVNVNNNTNPVMKPLIEVTSENFSSSQGGKHSTTAGDVMIGTTGSTGTYNSITLASASTKVYGYGGVTLTVATSGSLVLSSSGTPYFSPMSTSFHPTLGRSGYTFGQIYSTSTTISTSDRSAKTDIHYLDESQVQTMSSSADPKSKKSQDKVSFTTEDILNFVEKLNPCTFVYKDEFHKAEEYTDIESALSSNNTEYVQLGLIADDIKDEDLFNFIGATMEYDKVIEPEELDEDGNVVKEAVTETATTLGLKAVPLSVLALTACKYLINQVKELKEMLNNGNN